MKRVLRAFMGSALCLCLASAVALAAPPRGADSPYTVGDFAVDLARVMNLPADGSVDGAIASLQGAKINMKGNRSLDLTEGVLVDMLAQAGIAVTTSDPGKKVNKGRANTILTTFSGELSRGNRLVQVDGGFDETNPTNPNDDFNNGNGRGGKFKRKKKNSQTGSD